MDFKLRNLARNAIVDPSQQTPLARLYERSGSLINPVALLEREMAVTDTPDLDAVLLYYLPLLPSTFEVKFQNPGLTSKEYIKLPRYLNITEAWKNCSEPDCMLRLILVNDNFEKTNRIGDNSRHSIRAVEACNQIIRACLGKLKIKNYVRHVLDRTSLVESVLMFKKSLTESTLLTEELLIQEIHTFGGTLPVSPARNFLLDLDDYLQDNICGALGSMLMEFKNIESDIVLIASDIIRSVIPIPTKFIE